MSITWNGVSSDTIGVIVERIPNRYVPTRRFSPQQVAGRNGNILLVDKAFPNVEQEYEVYLSAEAQGLPSVARACAEWLMGPTGYCRLQDSYDTTVYREAFLMGGFDIENILNKFGRCTITFSCKPQKYLLTGDTPISIPAGSTTTYTGSSVQFDGITGASITSLSTTITPTQDLHGYANPWPAGGGVNKINYLSCVGVGARNGTESIYNNNTSISGTELTINQAYGNNGGILKGVGTFSLATGEYVTISGKATLVGSSDLVVGIGDYNGGGTSNIKTFVTVTDGKFSVTLNAKSDYAKTGIFLQPSRANSSMIVSDVMVALGQTEQPYSPYSNICPISGRTGLSVYVSPTQDPDDATVYNVDWTTQSGTVYGGTVDVVTGQLTVDAILEVFNVVGTNTIGSQINVFNKTSGGVGTIGDYTRISFAVRGDVDQTQYNRISSGYNYKISNMLKHYFAYNDQSAHWYRNTALYAFFPTSLVGSTAQSVYDYLVSIKDTTPLSVWLELATPLTYQLSAQEIGVLVGENNVWTSSGPVSATVATPLGGIVTNPTPFEARPMLEVSGLGEITINGRSIQILKSVSDFDIDCESMEAEDNSKIYCMDFPELSGGENEIVGDGSITALTVTPRWWTL